MPQDIHSRLRRAKEARDCVPLGDFQGFLKAQAAVKALYEEMARS